MNNVFHKVGHSLPTNHITNHIFITVGLAILLFLTYTYAGIYFTVAFGSSFFYWGREVAQWELRPLTKFEWIDVLAPKAVVFVIATILTLIF